jgi:hypothetical protein
VTVDPSGSVTVPGENDRLTIETPTDCGGVPPPPPPGAVVGGATVVGGASPSTVIEPWYATADSSS